MSTDRPIGARRHKEAPILMAFEPDELDALVYMLGHASADISADHDRYVEALGKRGVEAFYAAKRRVDHAHASRKRKRTANPKVKP